MPTSTRADCESELDNIVSRGGRQLPLGKEKDMTNKEYKEWLINGILDFQTKGQFTREVLERKSIRALEIIYDNVD